jgi:hypothetical protein
MAPPAGQSKCKSAFPHKNIQALHGGPYILLSLSPPQLETSMHPKMHTSRIVYYHLLLDFGGGAAAGLPPLTGLALAIMSSTLLRIAAINSG